MGVYLAQPITEKKIVEGKGKDFTFCSAEMQGIVIFNARMEKEYGRCCYSLS
jgi:hypothetical protein